MYYSRYSKLLKQPNGRVFVFPQEERDATILIVVANRAHRWTIARGYYTYYYDESRIHSYIQIHATRQRMICTCIEDRTLHFSTCMMDNIEFPALQSAAECLEQDWNKHIENSL